mgnify:CR=1 FL=1|jgi:hypothetical protein|tara:strand:- start:1558 stop:1755 length:198 start_codon:yes stop_codon:yes gene_type:complete
MNGRTITPLEALDLFQCFRLAARIKDLRDQGMPIGVRTIEDGQKSYAQYYYDPPVSAAGQIGLGI